MRGLLRLLSLRSLGILVAVALVLLAVDGGSVMLTRMSEPDDVRTAGYAAAAVAKAGPTTQQVAVYALQVAQQNADGHEISVPSKGFTIYPDGRVTLTGTKTAPTLLMHRLSFLKRFTEVSTTVTVEPLPYESAPSAFSRSQ